MKIIVYFMEMIDLLNPWFVLVLAIMFSTLGTACLKLSDGLRHIIPVCGVILGYSTFFILVTLIFKRIDMSLGYAVWSGLSTTMVSLVGVLFFKERLTIKKTLGLLLIVIGVVGLNLLN